MLVTTHRPVKKFYHGLKKDKYEKPSILDLISIEYKIDVKKEKLMKLLQYLNEKQEITTNGKDKTTKVQFLQNPTNPLSLITNKYTRPKVHVNHPEHQIANCNANPSTHKSSGKISDSFNDNPLPPYTPY
jgi:hypothetical protein